MRDHRLMLDLRNKHLVHDERTHKLVGAGHQGRSHGLRDSITSPCRHFEA